MSKIYDVALTESHFAAQDDDQVLDTTVGGILREAAEKAPDKMALVEGVSPNELSQDERVV